MLHISEYLKIQNMHMYVFLLCGVDFTHTLIIVENLTTLKKRETTKWPQSISLECIEQAFEMATTIYRLAHISELIWLWGQRSCRGQPGSTRSQIA